MKTESECIPCFHGQIARTLTRSGIYGERASAIVRKAEAIIRAASLDDIPARTTTVIHRLLRSESGTDPYRGVKEAYNRAALEKLPGLRVRVAAAEDRLEASVRAVIAGNVIDFGIYDRIDLDHAIDESFRLPLSGGEYRAFSAAIDRARKILYLCDNAGEIVFDRILLEMLKDRGKHTIAAVKGSPVINDATPEDAAAAGLAEVATVIDNGNDGIGTLLELCSRSFREVFDSADLIISKGQANYETLMQRADGRIFFLFKVKCRVVARSLGRENGDIVLMKNP